MHPSVDELNVRIAAAIAVDSFVEPHRGNIVASCDSRWA